MKGFFRNLNSMDQRIIVQDYKKRPKVSHQLSMFHEEVVGTTENATIQILSSILFFLAKVIRLLDSRHNVAFNTIQDRLDFLVEFGWC